MVHNMEGNGIEDASTFCVETANCRSAARQVQVASLHSGRLMGMVRLAAQGRVPEVGIA